jgi:polyisoprenoid-binding protein YceI
MKTRKYIIIAAMALAAACSKDDKNLNRFTVDENASVVKWKGAAPDHFHTGTFDVSGTVKTDGKGNITGGDFIIPITSITNDDLPDTTKPQLLNHLKSEDFFNVALYPNASFKILEVVDYKEQEGDAIEGANKLITGDFTMIGETSRIHFPAKIVIDNTKITTKAVFTINRLDWGMDSYSDPEGDLYILPDVDITLDITVTHK